MTSSTGASRSIRLAYDDERYVRLARAAFEGWRRLEAAQDVTLLVETGQIDLGPDAKLDALAAAMGAGDAPFDDLDATGIRRHFPELAVDAGERGLFHARRGHGARGRRRCARSRSTRIGAGAVLSMPERCVAIDAGSEGATVTTDRRTLRAERVVIAAGPWSGELLAMVGIDLPLAPAIAQVTFLEAPQLVERPGFVDWLRDDRVGVYGHPVPGIGYKVAFDAASTEPWLPDVDAWAPDLGGTGPADRVARRAYAGRRAARLAHAAASVDDDARRRLRDRSSRSDRRRRRMLRSRVQVRPGARRARRRRRGRRRSRRPRPVLARTPAMRTGHASPSTPITR